MSETLLTWGVVLFVGISPTFVEAWLHSQFSEIDARPGEIDI